MKCSNCGLTLKNVEKAAEPTDCPDCGGEIEEYQPESILEKRL